MTETDILRFLPMNDSRYFSGVINLTGIYYLMLIMP